MNAALKLLEEAAEGEQDATKKAELRRGLEVLRRSDNATERVNSAGQTTDMRDPSFKQIANQPASGEELANEKARRNREHGPLPETVRPPIVGEGATPPPIEAGVEEAGSKVQRQGNVSTTDADKTKGKEK